MTPLPPNDTSGPVHVAPRRRKLRGFSLIEAMTTVSIVGILATLSTYTVRERIHESKSAEAITMLGGMKKGVANSVNQSWLSSDGVVTIGERVTGFGGPLGGLTLLGKPGGKKSGETGSTGGGAKDSHLDGDGNHGHGDSGGCDPSNPAGCKDKGGKGGKTGSDGGGDDSEKGGGNGGGGLDDSDGDGNNGHGNSGGCDPSNPAGCKGNPGGGGSGDDGSDGASGGDADPATRICGSANPVPESFSEVSGKAYQSSPTDWAQGDRKNSWSCLRVTQNTLQHYQYGYDVGPPRAGTGVPIHDLPAGVDENQSFTAWARGDLDGDGRTSWFTLQGAVIDGQVYTAPAIGIVDQAE